MRLHEVSSPCAWAGHLVCLSKWLICKNRLNHCTQSSQFNRCCCQYSPVGTMTLYVSSVDPSLQYHVTLHSKSFFLLHHIIHKGYCFVMKEKHIFQVKPQWHCTIGIYYEALSDSKRSCSEKYALFSWTWCWSTAVLLLYPTQNSREEM